MPPRDASGGDTPPSTAAVLGQISGSPRKVHHMSAVILASLLGRGATPVREPYARSSITTSPMWRRSLHCGFDVRERRSFRTVSSNAAQPRCCALLSAPLCYTASGAPVGTLKSLSSWCASRRPGVNLHFAKTGTQVTADPERDCRRLGDGRPAVRDRRGLFLRRARGYGVRPAALGHQRCTQPMSPRRCSKYCWPISKPMRGKILSHTSASEDAAGCGDKRRSASVIGG